MVFLSSLSFFVSFVLFFYVLAIRNANADVPTNRSYWGSTGALRLALFPHAGSEFTI